jgi:hypothetical protein
VLCVASFLEGDLAMELWDTDMTDPFSIEERWAKVYLHVLNKLRHLPEYNEWGQITAKPPSLDLNAYYKQRGWKENHHAVQLARAAINKNNPAATIGLLLGIRIPRYRTLRLAFPYHLKDVGEYRTILPHNMDSNWFRETERLRHQHAQINFSFRFAPARDSKEPVDGMMWASMAARLPLYCGDVRLLETDGNKILGGQKKIPRFRSIGKEFEDFLGISSVLYVPCIYPDDFGEASVVLGFYSPIPYLFGMNERACSRVEYPLWLNLFTDRIFPQTIRDLLIERDMAYRHGLHRFATGVFSLIENKIKSIDQGLVIKWWPREVTGDLQGNKLSEQTADTLIEKLTHEKIWDIIREKLTYHYNAPRN